MNVKRVFIVLLALIIVASSLSAVSAGLLDGLFGSSQNNITDIGGFQFNIPDGYQLDNSSNNYENRYSMLYQSSMMTIFNNSSSLPQDNQIPAGNFFTAMDDDFKSSVVSSLLPSSFLCQVARQPRHIARQSSRQFCQLLCMISPEFSKRRSGEGGE